MKKLNLLIGTVLLALISTLGYAQAPESFNYQAVLRNADGSIIANQSVVMQFAVRTGDADGTVQYNEEQTLTTNEFGLVDHAVGTGTAITGTFDNISWDAAPKFLQVQLDNGGGLVDIGTQRLMSVPYALNAKTADALTGGIPSSGWNASGNNISNSNSGNVGVGTTNPIQKLDVNGRVNVTNGVIQRGGAAITATYDLGLYSRVAGNFMRFVTNNAPFNFYTQEGSNGVGDTPQMTIEANGDVGIGTATPTSKLSVAGSADISGKLGIGVQGPIASSFFIEAISDVDKAFRLFNFSGPLTAGFSNSGSLDGCILRINGIEGDGFWDFGQTDENDFRIARGPGGLNSTFIIKESGNVGIGTLDPNSTLHVNGGARISGGFIRLCTSPDNSQGNVGIGSGGFNDTKLDVTSNQPFGLYVNNPSASSWSLYVNGTAAKPGGGSWAAASDARLKDNVAPYTDGLAKILAIKPVSFHYNERSGLNTAKEYIGVIAQELQEVAPYMVSESRVNRNDDQEYLNVDNSAMTYMLINAVKEQQVKIEAQQAQINALLSAIEVLQNK